MYHAKTSYTVLFILITLLPLQKIYGHNCSYKDASPQNNNFFGFKINPSKQSQVFCNNSSCAFGFENKNKKAGTSREIPLPETNSKTIMSYDFVVNKDFMTAKGGKLPGLCGDEKGVGKTKTGSNDNMPGFSVRPMFYKFGSKHCLHTYVHPDIPTNNGGDASGKGFYYPARKKSNACFDESDKVSIQLEVELGSPGKANDCIAMKSSINNVETSILNKTCNFNLHRNKQIKINRACVHVFAGGNAEEWAPKGQAALCMSNFKIKNNEVNESSIELIKVEKERLSDN